MGILWAYTGTIVYVGLNWLTKKQHKKAETMY